MSKTSERLMTEYLDAVHNCMAARVLGDVERQQELDEIALSRFRELIVPIIADVALRVQQ